MTNEPPRDSQTRESDHILLERFRDGEEDAATKLFLKYGTRLRAFAKAKTSDQLASRFDPEDVVQSVFRTFFRRAANGLYDVPDGDELWQLLLVIALNKIRDLAVHHRALKRDVTRTEGGNDQSMAAANAGVKKSSIEVLKVVLEDFLESLPAKQSSVARLRMEGYQVEEIAEATKQSKRTVERVLNQLRKNLLTKMDFDT
jgi:RNA polymerase sigma-70 factor (ECF subfamily)